MKIGGILIFIVLFNQILSAQEADSTISEKESHLNRYNFNLLLESNPFYFDASQNHLVISPKDYWTDVNVDKYNIPLTEEMRYKVMAKDIRTDLNRAFSYQHQFQMKTDLGVVGKILGYASTAAAGYMLIKHVTKYADDYKKDFGIK